METLLEEHEELFLAQAPQFEATPITPGPSLESKWSMVQGANNVAQQLLAFWTRCLSAAPDDTLWYGTQDNGAWIYDLTTANPDYVQVLPLAGRTISSLAAVSKRTAWAVHHQTRAADFRIGKLDAGRPLEPAPALPNGKQPRRVAAGSDGTVWALSQDSFIFALSADRSGWSAIPTGEFTIERIAIGSARNIRALAKKGAEPVCLSYTAERGWEVDSQWPGGAGMWLAACEDGSAWVRVSAKFFTSMSAQAGWLEVTGMNNIAPNFPEQHAAGSARCCYARHPKVSTRFGCYKSGVLSLTRSWPTQTPNEVAAYKAVSTALTGEIPGGIRTQYTNANAAIEIYYSQLSTLKRPTGIDEAAWKTVKAQILSELKYVSSAYNLFKNLVRVTNTIGVVNATRLTGVEKSVGLDTNSPVDKERDVGLYVYTMWRSGIDAAMGVVPYPFSIATSLLSTAIFLAIDELTAQPEAREDPNYTFPLKFAALTSKMTKLHIEAQDKNSYILVSIVRDWGKLQTVGAEIARGAWRWDLDCDKKLVEAAAHQFELYFYRSLMAAKWQILQVDVIHTLNAGPPDWVATIPESLMHYEGPFLWEYNGHKYHRWSLWICNSRGNRQAPPPRSNIDPLPHEQLFKDLISLGENKLSILKGQNGWKLPLFRYGLEQQLASQGYLLSTFAEGEKREGMELFFPPPVEGMLTLPD